MLKNYPFDKNILNFICFGNHDAAYLNSSGQNVAKALENKRYDLCPIGFGKGKIIIKDDYFYLTHPNTFEKTVPDYDIVFQGHHHKIKTHTNGKNLMFYLPTLSDIGLQTHGSFPGFSLVKFLFDNRVINDVYIQNYNFINKKIRLTSENEFILNYPESS